MNVTQKVTDSEIYEVVNLVIMVEKEDLNSTSGQTELYPYLLDRDEYGNVFNRIDSTRLVKSDTIFSKEDLKFIEYQIKDRKHFKFSQKYIRSKKIISADTIQAFRESSLKKGDEFYLKIALPVFSVDKKTVFIKLERYGSGESMIYKKVNDKWKFYCFGSHWQA